MKEYNVVVSTSESTVVSEYESKGSRSDAYQSEAALEKSFIEQLEKQGYEYLEIHNEKDLINNLRFQLQKLNGYNFTDKEWSQFFNDRIANQNYSIADKSQIVQEDYIQSFIKEDGFTQNIKFIDKNNIHNNYLQVINQYEENEGTHKTRYDVTILVNGLPLVHIELKRRGVAIKEAFNQIKRYNRDSFWAGCGLYEYIQIFVISNGTHTKYYSNTTRNTKLIEDKKTESSIAKKKTSNSFEFTSYWADANNKVIPDLVDFTNTFFAKHTLLNLLTRYCVFTQEKLLLVMRPYQIVATEKILNRIETSSNYKKMGTIDAGGYIWHTTGSGKTLTSFKTAQLATELNYIDKVIFVVDRKDLDYQTMKEYDKFEKGAANGNKNTKILIRQLENKDENGNYKNYKIIVTTIQKLNEFISKHKEHDIYKKHVVLIFDECHRSQFGTMHQAIIKHFKNYHIFGFTGTPIFAENAPNRGNPTMLTTEQTFGDKLHTYTIVDAINDGNVLPFRIDYINTIKDEENIIDSKVKGIDTEKPYQDPQRISNIVTYILEHFDQKTVRNTYYSLKGKRLNGFNSIFATSSIPMAKAYYTEFKKQLEESRRDLSIATIFSFSANEEELDDIGILDDEDFDVSGMDKPSRDFLDDVIKEYNERYHTNFDSSSKGFEDYYKDLSDKVKKREIDLLIVVNMFLTGFDATTLNTLWVDKKLKQHGLIQAFSRTNRILNSVKTFGNIVCFRNLEKRVNDAIALFGDRDASGIVLMKTYDEYYYGYEEKGKHVKGYEERIAELIQKYPLATQIVGEKAEKDFIVSFGGILRLRNILNAFDEFEGNEILSQIDFQDYTGIYVDMRDKYRPDGEKENINDDLVFEMELVKQVEVNIDYIIMLVAKYHDSNCQDKTIRAAIDKAINSSLELRSKKELIENFIDSITVNSDVDEDWRKYLKQQKEIEIKKLIDEEKLKDKETRQFLKNCFVDGYVKTNGTDIVNIMPKVRRFGPGANLSVVKQRVIEKIKTFFDRFFGLINPMDLQEEEQSTAEEETTEYSFVPTEFSFVAEEEMEYKADLENKDGNH